MPTEYFSSYDGKEVMAKVAEYDSDGNRIADSLATKLQGIKLAGVQSPIAPDAGHIVTIPLFSGSDPGLVPSATAGDADKALRGDGTWGDVSSVSVSYDSVNEQLHLDFSPQVSGGN